MWETTIRRKIRIQITTQTANVAPIQAPINTITGPPWFVVIAEGHTTWMKHVPRRLIGVAPTTLCNGGVLMVRIRQNFEPGLRTVEFHRTGQTPEVIAHVSGADANSEDHDAPLNHFL